MKKRKRSLWFYLIIVTIGLIAVGSAVLRHEQNAVEGASRLAVMSSTLLLTLVLLGPSIIGKHLFLILLPILKDVRERNRLRRALRDDERRVSQAERRLAQLEMHEQWWTQEAETIKAGYNLAYIEYGGKLPQHPYQP